jgi:hypothetical protein
MIGIRSAVAGGATELGGTPSLSARDERRLSLVFAATAVLVLFADPRVLLRIAAGPQVAELVGIAAVLTMVGVMVLRGGIFRVNGVAALLLIFGFLSLLRFTYAGLDIRVGVQMLPPFIGAAVIAAFGFRSMVIRHLFVALAVAMLLHCAAVFLRIGAIAAGLDVQTQFGATSHLWMRATGFTPAPGILSLLASVGVAIGLIMFLEERRWLWGLLVVTSFACGAATLNRSFVAGFATVAFTVPWLALRGRQRLAFSILMPAIALLLTLVLLTTTEYVASLTERFTGDDFRSSMEMRLTGEAGLLRALGAAAWNPLFGSLRYSHEYRQVLAYDGQQFVMVHNGIAWMLASRGVVIGGMFLIVSLAAAQQLRRVTKHAAARSDRTLAAALLAAFIAGHAVNLVESFLESFVMLMPIALGLVAHQVATRPTPRESP